MSGTNFTSGVAVRKQYSGSTTATDNSKNNATTKFIRKQAVIRCDAQTTETQTAFTLPTNAIVHDVMVNVIAIDATETVDVGTQGTSNDPNGYLALAALGVVGLVAGDLVDGSITLGVLLYEETGTGADVAYARRADITAGGDPISYTCSAGSDPAVFALFIDSTVVVAEANE